MEDFYREAADRIAAHLDAGRDVALLAEGDPLFYSSYMHMHTRLTERFDAVIVPGVTSVSAASAATGDAAGAGRRGADDPAGHAARRRARRRLADTDAAVILKLGRSYPAVREALSAAGRLDEAYYVERASTPRATGAARRRRRRRHRCRTSRWRCCPAVARAARATVGSVAVVGLGPGDAEWMTPQSRRELAAATDLIGYGPYLDRIARPRRSAPAPQRQHRRTRPRAAGVQLAEQGRAVAVVSSGDPGVFAMATAVARGGQAVAGREVRVIPAMTAAQAVASRVGAPLGHDYAVISLSDRLKPWDVIATRLAAAAAADLVLAIYNPASKSRTWQVGAMRDLLLEHRDPGTPVVIGRDVAGPERAASRWCGWPTWTPPTSTCAAC